MANTLFLTESDLQFYRERERRAREALAAYDPVGRRGKAAKILRSAVLRLEKIGSRPTSTIGKLIGRIKKEIAQLEIETEEVELDPPAEIKGSSLSFMSINTAVIKVDPYLTFMFRTQGGSKAWSLRLNLRPEGGRPPDLVRQFLILRAAEDYERRTGKRAAASKVFFGFCAEIFDAVFPEPSDGLEDQIRRILRAYRAGLLQSRTSLFSV